MISEEEEEKAIKNIKHVKEELNKDKQKMIDYGTYKLYEMFSNDLDTVLNLIEKQNKELEIKDKMIDELMPRVILTIKENEEVLEKQSKSVNKSFIDCIKEYFRKKIENEY